MSASFVVVVVLLCRITALLFHVIARLFVLVVVESADYQTRLLSVQKYVSVYVALIARHFFRGQGFHCYEMQQRLCMEQYNETDA